MAAVSRLVLPGDLLEKSSRKYKPGDGCYRSGEDELRASVCGHVSINSDNTSLCVEAIGLSTVYGAIPRDNAVVICVVVGVTSIYAKVRILCVNDTIQPEPLKGVIRRENIRATEKDSVQVFDSFRPRDIVRAKVLGIGESLGYTLTTAENELGVVVARSHTDYNQIMQPLSWSEVMDYETGRKEKRKVAKLLKYTTSNNQQ